MQNGKLPDSVLTASSMLSATYAPGMARLHQTAASGRGGSWIAKTQDLNQWLQVDFGVETTITRIDTQGRQDGSQWVKEYTLRYSNDGSYFKQYQPEGYTKVCCSHRGIVKNCLSSPAWYLSLIRCPAVQWWGPLDEIINTVCWGHRMLQG